MQTATSPEVSAPSSNLWPKTFQAKCFSLGLYFFFLFLIYIYFIFELAYRAEIHKLLWQWGLQSNYVLYEKVLSFVLKLLPVDFFQCPVVLVLPEGMSHHSQISGFDAFQDFVELSHFPSLNTFSDWRILAYSAFPCQETVVGLWLLLPPSSLPYLVLTLRC